MSLWRTSGSQHTRIAESIKATLRGHDRVFVISDMQTFAPGPPAHRVRRPGTEPVIGAGRNVDWPF